MRLRLMLVLAAAVLLAGCLDEEEESGTAVEYRVNGSACAVDVTISNEEEGTSQFGPAALPWTYAFVIPLGEESGFFVYVSAQNQCSSGSVTAEIFVDGEEFRSSTSSGAFVIATASGSL